MTKNVVGIRGEPVVTPAAEPHPGVVDCLEKLLEKAKAGEIQGILGAYLYRDGASGRFTVGVMSWNVAARAQNLINETMRDMEER